MTWQWVVLSVAAMAFIAVMTHLGNKKAMGDKGLQMMDEGNVLIQQFIAAQEAARQQQ